jgi:peptide/nickel transport system permease protein
MSESMLPLAAAPRGENGEHTNTGTGRTGAVARLLLRRAALGVLTLLLVSIVVFGATQVLPGDAATAILGKNATPASIAALTRQLHLNQPVYSQYWQWLSHIVRGNAGISFAAHEPVSQLLSTRAENSAFLVAIAALVAIPLSLLLGTLAAARRDRVFDHVLTAFTLVVAALPEFVTAILLIVVFGTTVVHWLPPVSLLAPGQPAWRKPEVIVLPAATLVLAVTPYISRIVRGSMVEVLASDYIQMARLKGLRRSVVIFRHALPNALVPAVQVSAMQLAWMAGGVVLVEYVFAFPGVGSALVDAVSNRDLPVIQAITLGVAAVYVALNLLADVMTVILSPRAKTSLR